MRRARHGTEVVSPGDPRSTLWETELRAPPRERRSSELEVRGKAHARMSDHTPRGGVSRDPVPGTRGEEEAAAAGGSEKHADPRAAIQAAREGTQKMRMVQGGLP
ncbi:unnamed protein product [Lampetra planeri]